MTMSQPPIEHPHGHDDPPDLRHGLRVLAALLDEIHDAIMAPSTAIDNQTDLARRIRAHSAVLVRLRRDIP